MNTGCGMLSVNWAKDFVHPCSELKATWFNNTDSNEEVCNEWETWDFKRKRYAPL